MADKLTPREEVIVNLKELRTKIGAEADLVFELKGTILSKGDHMKQGADKIAVHTGEAMANVMLSFRHLEDARMRLGKAIQALDGGKSVYKD